VVEQLMALLEGDPTERAAACHALGSLHHEPAVPFLMDALFDPSPRVRHAAAIALTRLGAREPTRREKSEQVRKKPPKPVEQEARARGQLKPELLGHKAAIHRRLVERYASALDVTKPEEVRKRIVELTAWGRWRRCWRTPRSPRS
jgi:HEAT repeat protein